MFETRIKSLQNTLSQHEINALLITSPYNIAYLTGIHAFSIEEREARILITKTNIYLFTDARYTGMVNERANFVTLLETSSENPFLNLLKQILEKELIKSLEFEEENITYKEASTIEEQLTNIEFLPNDGIVEAQRKIKDAGEIESIKKACALTDKGFEYVITLLKPGVTENEIKAQLENFIRLSGGEIAFSSIVAFGANSAIPHHLSSNSRLQSSDIILLDFGAKIDGYCSDMTRTVFLQTPTEKQKNIYKATMEAQEVAIDYLKTHTKEGFLLKKAQELANSHIRKMGFTDIPHSLGHGVGLQVHEEPVVSPFSEDQLGPGMIITVEPGVYIPEFGGARIEDTCLVTPEGLELLTKSSKELTIL